MVYLIAEVGVNHKGNLAYALEHVHAAKAAGANAVKFQTFKAGELASVKYAKDQVDFFSAVELQYPEFARLYEETLRVGIDFLSTPFDVDAVDFLDKLPVKAFKIASGDLTNHPLLAFVARKCKPIFLSTGMSNIGEVSDAIGVLRRNGNQDVTVLHCVSLYPTPACSANLRAIRTLTETFDLPVGYSDHTVGTEACLAAVALGAVVVEKHFTLDKAQPGPDIALSASPEELAALRKGIDFIAAALGDGKKIPQAGEEEMSMLARRSVFTTRAIEKGELITPDLLAVHRPGTGIPASQIGEVVGHRLKNDVAADDMLRWEMLEGV
jgi:N,N'-diacetyllegionaminate synthase